MNEIHSVPGYYILIANKVEVGGKSMKASEIIHPLLERKRWLFSPTAPFLKRYNEGTKFLFYAGGPGERHFLGWGTADGSVESFNAESTELPLPYEAVYFFGYKISLKHVVLFEKPIPIAGILESFSFVTQTRYWGLYFRQGAKQITAADFHRVVDLVNPPESTSKE